MTTVELVSWNVRQSPGAWSLLLRDAALDVALLQDACPPPEADQPLAIAPPEGEWRTAGWKKLTSRCVVARWSERVSIEPIAMAPLDDATDGELAISRFGTLAAAHVLVDGAYAFTCASIYGVWEHPVPYHKSNWIYADASVHRLISDLSALIDTQDGHRLVVAGDLNILRGYGEGGSHYWKGRYGTVFDRFEAIGLVCKGPELDAAGAGNRADEMPKDSRTIPTFRRVAGDLSSEIRQLDFVFASRSIADRVSTRVTDICEPSDHRQIRITVTTQ